MLKEALTVWGEVHHIEHHVSFVFKSDHCLR